MDPGTIVGITLAVVGILGSMMMEGSSPTALFLLPPMLLVFGGTIGAAMAGTVFSDVKGLGHWFKVAFSSKVSSSDGLVRTLVSLADRARREGLLALEDATREVTDPFMRRGLELAIDGTDPEELHEILDAEIDAKRIRDRQGAKVFADMGGYAPTMGIIGTVIGLVHVLENLSNPTMLGPLIASAFVATLWGIMSANVLWLPMANKVRRVSEIECARMELVLEGIMAIQAGSNPRVVAHKLNSLLAEAPGKGKDAGKGSAKKAA